MRSLRSQLVFFWIFLLAAGVALGLLTASVYRDSAGVQVAAGRAATEQACRAISLRYAKSMPQPAPAAPQTDLLQVLLQLVLIDVPHVEGGVWQEAGGMLAYAYPTYEGSGVKRDVPVTEQPLIVQLAQQAARTGQPQTDVVRGSREALIVAACPLAPPGAGLAAWTMTRTHAGALAAQGSLHLALGALLLTLLASGGWLAWILVRGLRHVQRIEERIATADADHMPLLQRTGLRELDLLVDAFNRYRARFAEARDQLQAGALQRARDQRLAALGRMTAGIAHEIRNPIAAMRLKAENALAAEPGRQQQALVAIVGQVDRLDGLVRSLLSLVQPVLPAPQSVDLAAWLDERRDSVAGAAAARGIDLAVESRGAATAVFDPVHLARAVDNLLDNAVRHATAGGRVRLSADNGIAAAAADAQAPSAEPGATRSLVLRVTDDGAGVAAAQQATLFEPFATGRADGTGLGLALAREVVLAHGGDIRYRRDDGTSVFEMELPWPAS